MIVNNFVKKKSDGWKHMSALYTSFLVLESLKPNSERLKVTRRIYSRTWKFPRGYAHDQAWEEGGADDWVSPVVATDQVEPWRCHESLVATLGLPLRVCCISPTAQYMGYQWHNRSNEPWIVVWKHTLIPNKEYHFKNMRLQHANKCFGVFRDGKQPD